MTYNATISACEVSCQQERAFQLQDDTQTRGRMQTFDALTFPIKKVSTSVNVDLSLFALTPRRLARTATKAKATSTPHDLKAKTTISIVSGKGGATHSRYPSTRGGVVSEGSAGHPHGHWPSSGA